MTQFIFGLALVVALVGGNARGFEHEAEVVAETKGHVLARMGESESSAGSGYRQLFLYSEVELTGVEYRYSNVETWLPLIPFTNPDFKVYGTSSYVDATSGKGFVVRGVRADGTRFTDTLTVGDNNISVKVAGLKEETAEEVTASKPAVVVPPVCNVQQPAHVEGGMLQQPFTGQIQYAQPVQQYATQPRRSNYANPSAVYGGGHSAQEVAQARANEMAATGVRGHLPGGGALHTAQGTLSEGTGWGRGMMPSTCTATNGTAAVADATAVAPNGEIIRVRLYNSPGTTSGGSRGWGRR